MNYTGPIRKEDWEMYHCTTDHNSWEANLDSMKMTTCLCTNPPHDANRTDSDLGTVASSVEFDFWSHHLGQGFYLGPLLCGPAPAHENGENNCWELATGTSHKKFERHGKSEGTVCRYYDGTGKEEDEKMCVGYEWVGRRWLWFGEQREDWDSVGIKSEQERHETVKGVCESGCWESFGMGWADYWEAGLGPSFVGTWWLPRPIVW